MGCPIESERQAKWTKRHVNLCERGSSEPKILDLARFCVGNKRWGPFWKPRFRAPAFLAKMHFAQVRRPGAADNS